MANIIAGDHYIVLLLPIDPRSTILMGDRDLKRQEMYRHLGWACKPSSLRVYLPRLPLRQTWCSLQKSERRIVEGRQKILRAKEMATDRNVCLQEQNRR